MYTLMQRYYINVNRKQFIKDLTEKEYVISLNHDGILRGFSTWMTLHHKTQGHNVNIIFSGDTIIEKDYWGSLALPLAWVRLMLTTFEQNPGQKLYWLMTSKGYKTYRYLPVFFQRFYPCYGSKPPLFEETLGIGLGDLRYGKRFNPKNWVIKARPNGQRLRPGIAEIPPERLRDRHIAFFSANNPNHAQGDELLCLAECHTNNLRPFILRQLLK